MPFDDVRARLAAPLLLATALFTAAGGFIHLREWSETYRAVPASAPGAALVRVGFPINGALSLLVAGLLVWCAVRPVRRTVVVVAAAIALQVGSLAVLILTRTGTVLGWTEPVWTRGANQSRAVEIGALITAVAVLGLQALGRHRAPAPGTPALAVPAGRS